MPISTILSSYIEATKAGVPLQISQLVRHHQAGGRISELVKALMTAKQAGISLSFNQAAALDLAGQYSSNDIHAILNSAIHPWRLEAPSLSSGREAWEALSKDGVRLKLRMEMMVRTNIKRGLIGPTFKEKLIARMGEVGVRMASQLNHRELLENPDWISQFCLESKLDRDSGLDLVSVKTYVATEV